MWVTRVTFCDSLLNFHASHFFLLPKGDEKPCSSFVRGFLGDADETKATNPF